MDIFRYGFDCLYDIVKPAVFLATRKDPEKAHELFVLVCKFLYKTKLEKIILDNKANKIEIPFELSNAAGSNKNGEIPPSTLRYLGFDRVVIGTVNNDAYIGNPKPRCIRYPKLDSMINWVGFPCNGSKIIAETLSSYGNHEVPLTINFMSTSGKHGNELLRDLEGTMLDLRDIPYVDRFELNISCPNTLNECGSLDARDEHQKQLDDMLMVVEKLLYEHQELYIKVSPDLESIDDIVSVAKDHLVDGFTVSNISTNYDDKDFPNSLGRGGVSGNAVYNNSLRVQKLFQEYITKNNESWKLIACGGINSIEKIKERLLKNTIGIQVLTSLIFSGPRILRELRKFNA